MAIWLNFFLCISAVRGDSSCTKHDLLKLEVLPMDGTNRRTSHVRLESSGCVLVPVSMELWTISSFCCENGQLMCRAAWQRESQHENKHCDMSAQHGRLKSMTSTTSQLTTRRGYQNEQHDLILSKHHEKSNGILQCFHQNYSVLSVLEKNKKPTIKWG